MLVATCCIGLLSVCKVASVKEDVDYESSLFLIKFKEPHVASSNHIGQHSYNLCGKTDDPKGNDSRYSFGQHINSAHPACLSSFAPGNGILGGKTERLIILEIQTLLETREINWQEPYPSPAVMGSPPTCSCQLEIHGRCRVWW